MTSRPVLGRLFKLATLGTAVVAAYHYRSPIGVALQELKGLDAIVFLVLPLFVFWNWIASFAWLELHRLLTIGTPPTAWRLSLIRLQAQALNLVLPLASVGGEVMRAAILSRSSGQIAGTASAVILDKIADAAAGVALAMGGVLLAMGQVESNATSVVVLAGLLLIALGGLPLALRIAAKRIRQGESWLVTALAPIRETHAEITWTFYRAVAWHFAERLLTAVEIYIAMLATGMDVAVMDAIFVAAVMTAYSLVFFFIPGQLGAIEAGIVSAFMSLGLSPETALTVALVRRARQLALIFAGTLVFLIGPRPEGKTPNQEATLCD